MNAEEFQLHVVDKLSSLNTKMETLIGNGQPGRIGKLENSVEDLKKARWSLAGTIGGITTLLSIAGAEAIHFLFHSK